MFPVVLMKNNLQICGFSILKTITAKFFLTFAVLIITQQMFAQFADDFSDGDFTDSPAWTGMDSKFIIDNQSLKLQAAPVADIAYLTTPSSTINHASWEFLVRLEFNPSATNFPRIYLVSDQAELSQPLNGYYVLVGNTTDDVSLYKQTGATSTKLIDGVDARLDLPAVSIKIKTTRDDFGRWELLVDVGPTGTYVSEGTAIDASYSSSLFFGIFCNYTSTRSDKFYFDDFTVTGDSSSDKSPPELALIEVISSEELRLTFSEELNKETAEAVINYNIDHDLGNPVQATLAENKKTVQLTFEKSFSNGLHYTITISGIKDVAGNFIHSTNRNFVFIQTAPANQKDVIFTEIFADPSPRIGLPEVEFAELFNRSENPFDLKGWQIMDESSSMILPSLILLPGEYLVLASSSTEFSSYGKVWGDPDFPSLNNAGDILMIKDSNGFTVDSVNYNDGWYRDEERKNGGWSLELIDPQNLCSEGENWVASEDSSGGTPGSQNSVFANKPDLTGPSLLLAIPLSSTLIQLSFSEKLEKSPPQENNFTITPSVEITGISFSNTSLRNLQLSLAHDLQPGVVYSITANAIYDCAGNSIAPEVNKREFGMPEPGIAGDIVINEILFNPRPTGVDFVEIVNASLKFINLKNWYISNVEQDSPKDAKAVTREDLLIQPGAYLVLTENLDVLKAEYPLLDEKNVLLVDDLPGFNDDEGSAGLVNDHHQLIDYFFYSDDMHTLFINDEEGVSLERINFTRPTNETQNWKSASSLAGFATPGYLNSNSKADLTLSEESIRIEPEVFIPIMGQPDFTQIHYKFNQGGYVGNIKVFDERGHLIKRIANNEVLGTEGILRWDGDRDDGNKARIGYYMIWIEVFDATGIARTYRKRVGIASRF